MSHPDWALAHKKKNTELRCIRGRFYLYQVSSVWDKERKRPVKKTGKCLGTITEKDGFLPSKARYAESVRVIVFLDEQLKVSEEHDYLDRIEKNPDKYTIEEFHVKHASMGIISTIDNLPDKSPKEIYQTYKSRCEIEQLFNIFKNEPEADKTHMHSIESLRAWLFIKRLAIVAYYKIYRLLNASSLLDKYYVNDILERLYHIAMVKIGDTWTLQAISIKTDKLLIKIGFSLPITWNGES